MALVNASVETTRSRLARRARRSSNSWKLRSTGTSSTETWKLSKLTTRFPADVIADWCAASGVTAGCATTYPPHPDLAGRLGALYYEYVYKCLQSGYLM